MAILLLSLMMSMAADAASPSPACEAKRREIERRIAEAESADNRYELAGLKNALRANQSHCTTRSLEAERTREIRDATKEVAEREADLAEAKRKGKISKIEKQEAKLAEARAKLATTQTPLPR